MIDHVYLTSNNITADGAQLHDDRTSFDSAGAGECELCNNFSASSSFFLLVFEPAPGGGAIYWIPPIPRTIPSILSKDSLPTALYVTVLAKACTKSPYRKSAPALTHSQTDRGQAKTVPDFSEHFAEHSFRHVV